VHRIAIELINADETETIAKDRAARQAWLEARGYRVVTMRVGDVEDDLAKELDRLESGLEERR
jgi:tRNA/rRNA methyltransferase